MCSMGCKGGLQLARQSNNEQRRLCSGLRNYADCCNTRRARTLPLYAQEAQRLDACEDDGGMTALSTEGVRIPVVENDVSSADSLELKPFRRMNIEERISRASLPVEAPLIVGVACFEGDIAAPSELVSALPADCVATFIFVQQLSARRETVLAESLAKRTTLPVIHALGGLVVERGRLYVIPPNANPTMTGSCICVTPGASGIDCPADTLFTSLAQEFGNNAIGVILSGGGSDRALGIRAIREAGGTTFAQYPGSARFPNLPISAIDTGCVDFVLRPNEIAHELARISRHSRTFCSTTRVGQYGTSSATYATGCPAGMA